MNRKRADWMGNEQEITRLHQGIPVRRVGTNHRSLTGKVITQGAAVSFESSLERDFLVMMDWDHSVSQVHEQPLSVPYQDADGRSRLYTPDFLVSYVSGASVLYEIKYRADLKTDWRLLKPKFRGAIRFARENGIRFSIMTEVEIRTGYLKNIKFLRPYRDRRCDQAIEEHLINTLATLGETTPDGLLKAAYWTSENRMRALGVLWRLVAIGRVQVDIFSPLTMTSSIWVTIGEGFLCKDPHSFR